MYVKRSSAEVGETPPASVTTTSYGPGTPPGAAGATAVIDVEEIESTLAWTAPMVTIASE